METTLKLNVPGVKELCKEDLKHTEGGGGGMIFPAISTFAFMYAVDIAVNWDDHVQAFKEGYNRTRNK